MKTRQKCAWILLIIYCDNGGSNINDESDHEDKDDENNDDRNQQNITSMIISVVVTIWFSILPSDFPSVL